MDSRIDTYQHKSAVAGLMLTAIADLQQRMLVHDDSKLESPEVEIFDEFTPRLASVSYGSDAYRARLAAMEPALDHHYAVNSHHPEHFSDGIRAMSLFDLVEMICDWIAASSRHADGDPERSIHLNQERFGYSDELREILLNTLTALDA